MTDKKFRFAIDRGGTFTDIYCEVLDATGSVTKKTVLKLLSEDPMNYKDAPTEGIRRLLESESGVPHPRGVAVDTSRIEFIRMGTTVATNALLERKGERIALFTTRGFEHLQLIGNQSRPKIFDLQIKRPDLLYESVVEINERVILVKEYTKEQYQPSEIVMGRSHEMLVVEQRLDMAEVEAKLQQIYDQGMRSLAVVFLHSYTFPQHEIMVKTRALEMGFEQVSISSEIMPMIRAVPRGGTTCVDAYLTPVIKRYLASFASGFDAGLANVNVSFMQSDGGLTPMSSFLGNKAILSGPAGGVVGYAITSELDYKHNIERINSSQHSTPPSPSPSPSSSPPPPLAVIGFDMGGTSTDVSRYAGVYEHVFESNTAGVTIQSPQLDINTVAAGGGSRLFYRNGLFVVGPESAGAHPGPVCYRKGGPLTVTDANVFLGRVQPHLFPAIFGPNEDQPLDWDGTRQAFEALTQEINRDTELLESTNKQHQSSQEEEGVKKQQKTYTPYEVAYGFIRVANEAMARPIRNLTTMKGYDVTKHTLSCFGGAGPQHCCAIAKSLGMTKVLVHRYSGILSAYGLSLADVVVERQEPFNSGEISETLAMARERLDALEEAARGELLRQGFPANLIETTRYLNCRYQGTDTSMMTSISTQGSSCTAVVGYKDTFTESYRREFGFELVDRPVLVDDVRVRAVGRASTRMTDSNARTCTSTDLTATSSSSSLAPPVPKETVLTYFDDQNHSTPVYMMESLVPGHSITGPAIIVQNVATVVVEPRCRADITHSGDIAIDVQRVTHLHLSTKLDPIYLSVFSHRFMGIAEQMGRTLQRTSVSVNIKERLDFSCALFDPQGGLVANAPHLPVHLGAMSEAVRYQVKFWGADLVEGDVLVSNHPQLAGGSHLPDITVTTPIFQDGKIVFFVASRGHHADVGGIAPGSMPPLSKTLVQEGAAIIAFKLVRDGIFQEKGVTELLQAPGLLEGNFGTRNLSDNISDLKAQVAANQKGAALMHELVNEYGLQVVCAYMGHIQSCADLAVRDMLRRFSVQEGMAEVGVVRAEDFLDDGSPIRLAVTIDRAQGTAVFDFEGTGAEMYGNLNAPPAVTTSAILYCLRCFVPEIDIPLNQGCLNPIDIKIPPNTLLNPSSGAAVVGGNVLTSQRVTDVVLKAFKACAASQGCMNNLTFGDATMGYYETIAGGAGAGPNWHGCSAVHTHMTNTRITDPEILEKRYPVILRQFSLRKGSGGSGKFCGGDGVVRELQFTKPLVVSILSERRAFAPYGLAGGEPGARGLNVLRFHADQREVSLGGKNTIHVGAGDRLSIHSPGGGGYGYGYASPQHQHQLLEPAVVVAGKEEDESEHPPATASATTAAAVMTSGSLHQYSLNQESV